MPAMSQAWCIIVGVACGLAMLTVFGMCWVHAEWSTGNRFGHLALAVALGAVGGRCLNRGLASPPRS